MDFDFNGINKVSFGKHVRKCRKEKGMTQLKLAEEIDVLPKTISCIERGESYPTQENIFKLAKVLDMSLDEFVFGYKKGADIISVKEINDMLEDMPDDKKVFLLATMKNICENLKCIK